MSDFLLKSVYYQKRKNRGYYMKSAVYSKAGQVGLVEVERPQIEAPDDVILRIVRTCVCGSDLWSYRNPDIEEGYQMMQMKT